MTRARATPGPTPARGERRKPLTVIRVSQAPQAVVRIVPRGGARTAKQILGQWKYLSRNGKVPLQRSERHLGLFLAPDQVKATAMSWVSQAENWSDDASGRNAHELTTHIVLSFPQEIERSKAFAAGRAWAEAMFGCGAGGGTFDYLTVCHSDRPHPHVHLVVNRRALEGHWLKIARRNSWHNYETMRSVMVDVARRHGIELEATSRLARGIKVPAITYAEYRRRAREKHREPADAGNARDPES